MELSNRADWIELPRSGALSDVVAQIDNLLCRRMAFGKSSEPPRSAGVFRCLRTASPRYSRLPICVTGLRCPSALRFRQRGTPEMLNRGLGPTVENR